jgi:ribosome-associated heat shock protein Hsp15
LDRQRIDKWLWHARVVRTRTAAAALAAQGHVRVNGQRIDAASRAVRAGDVVTVALDRTVRVLKVLGFTDRRGAAPAAQVLWEDLTPPALPPSPESLPVAMREAGAGRPTKRERRALDRLHGEGDA